jgi:type II secretory pathway component GspD/PulD (secretin)
LYLKAERVPIIFNKMLRRKSKKSWAFSSTVGSTVKVVLSNEAHAIQQRERAERREARARLTTDQEPESDRASRRRVQSGGASAQTIPVEHACDVIIVSDDEDVRPDGDDDEDCVIVEIGVNEIRVILYCYLLS